MAGYRTSRAGCRSIGDVIFLSTSADGSTGALKSEILSELGLPDNVILSAKDLISGFHFVPGGENKICFVVTVSM